MIQFAVGISSEHDAFKAGAEASRDAIALLNGKTPVGALAFASVAFDQDRFLEGVNSLLPQLPIAGGSTAGEISTEGLQRESSGVVVMIASDQCSVASSAVHHLGSNAKGSGREFARLSRGIAPTAKHGLLFLDPFCGSIDGFLSGFSEEKSGELVLTGIGTGDDFLYRETFQYRDKGAHTRSATALLFSGSFATATASTHGFIPVGMPEEVTKSVEHVVLEIAGKPAIELYRSYFGQKHMDLLSTTFGETTAVYPLGMKTAEGHLVQIPTTMTKEGGLEFLRHVPVGSEVRLMVGDVDATIEGAREAARAVLRDLGGRKLKGLIVFSSAARRRLLGARADEEVRAIQDIVGREVPIAGMYGYAEVLSGPAHFSQATMTLWGIAE
jgi:hypothetical protein